MNKSPASRYASLLALALLAGSLLLLAGCGGNHAVADPGVAIATVAPSATPQASPEATSTPDPNRPTAGRWIDVDVTRFQVQLMDGSQVLKTIAPVAVGVEINSGAYESTQTGLFHVYDKRRDLAYDPPYQTYISDWVAFDPAKDNGFHSFLKDASGNVVDASTGRISNGCIRTGDSTAVFDFAQIGMPVYLHV